MFGGIHVSAAVALLAPKRPAVAADPEVDWGVVAACMTGALLLFAVLAIVLLAIRERRSAAAQTVLREQLVRAETERQHAAAAAQRLSRYEVIADAEAAAATYRAQTEAWAARTSEHAQREAGRVAAEAQTAAVQLGASARTEAERLVASAQATVAQAQVEATRIVGDANRRAEETAGDALQAVREAKRLEQTAQAMKNVIEGYGDRYVMPSAGLLDELAEEFGFTDAGKRLKAARAKSRDMIADALAATCDYAEANRRTTAILFVLDAFNGKVDTILADVKNDNFGTLQQKIRDAFTLVNQNGRAFRDARVLPQYLEARIEELRWAVVAQALKQKEREEQRELKERMREEEKAQREFEKARKEAEKEEDVLRKAMEKARADVEKSTDEERARFEQKLLELSDRLRAAEQKSQRAISMAQQTKRGHVYVISNIGSFGEDVYKIGMTRREEPRDRVHELGDASVPFEFDVHALIPSDNAPALEHLLHQRFVRNQVNKMNPRKEFFRIPLQEVRQEIEKLNLGIEVAWTLTAAAREFRETQATERALANKTIDEAAWVRHQVQVDAASVREPEIVEATA